jgi:rare lipoprotein A
VRDKEPPEPAYRNTVKESQGVSETAGIAPRRTGDRPLGRGLATWYEHPGRTASGEAYRPDGLTAAHRTLPFGTKVKVTNAANGRSVVVRINDRYSGPRPLAVDLSRGAARRLGIEGTATVALHLVSSPIAVSKR